MRPISNHIDVDRPPEHVFARLSDLENEAAWNPELRFVRRLTAGPLGAGTVFAAHWKGGPPMQVRYVRFEPPRLWQAEATGRGLTLLFTGEVEPVGPKSRFTATMALRPKGFVRLLAPLLRRKFQSQEEVNLRMMKQWLERESTGPDKGT